MKSFKTYIREVALGTGSAGLTSEVDPDFHRIDQQDVRARVNNWLSASMQVEYMNVDAALRQLAGKVEQSSCKSCTRHFFEIPNFSNFAGPKK